MICNTWCIDRVVAGPLDAGIVLVTNFEETVVKSSLVQQFVVGA